MMENLVSPAVGRMEHPVLRAGRYVSFHGERMCRLDEFKIL